MRSFIRFSDFKREEVLEIFKIADELQEGKYRGFLSGKTVVMFFPSSSIRTRIAFERGIYLLGGQTILFPPEALDKKEDIKDVSGYLNNWADLVVVRHRDISLLDKIDQYSKFSVINAMTSINHPCEIMTDLYSLSKLRKDFLSDKYLFCGEGANIGLAWREAAEVMGFSLAQCCPRGHEMEGIPVYHDINEGIKGRDIICTDPYPSELKETFKDFQITKSLMDRANPGALLNPCPPFYRGAEVSEDVIASDYFVGYEFKKYLVEVQQAVMIFSLMSK